MTLPSAAVRLASFAVLATLLATSFAFAAVLSTQWYSLGNRATTVTTDPSTVCRNGTVIDNSTSPAPTCNITNTFHDLDYGLISACADDGCFTFLEGGISVTTLTKELRVENGTQLQWEVSSALSLPVLKKARGAVGLYACAVAFGLAAALVGNLVATNSRGCFRKVTSNVSLASTFSAASMLAMIGGFCTAASIRHELLRDVHIEPGWNGTAGHSLIIGVFSVGSAITATFLFRLVDNRAL